MTAPDVAMMLNRHVTCPQCGLRGNWGRVGRARVRTNSTLYRFCCRGCAECVVAKLALLPQSAGYVEDNVEQEYQTLQQLQALFSSESEYGTLTPVGYLEANGFGVMVTRLFAGCDLARYMRTHGTEEACQMCRRVGVLLRKLHDACPDTHTAQFRVQSKLEYLDSTYGGLLVQNHATHCALTLLQESAVNMEHTTLRRTWVHGDFKPENILYDGFRMVTLDTLLINRDAFVYDIASFLDHVLIAGWSLGGRAIRRGQDRIEAAFLSGYGELDREEAAALRWAQLYFMLCYFGMYAKRGMWGGLYARWPIAGLVEMAAGRLTDARD